MIAPIAKLVARRRDVNKFRAMTKTFYAVLGNSGLFVIRRCDVIDRAVMLARNGVDVMKSWRTAR